MYIDVYVVYISIKNNIAYFIPIILQESKSVSGAILICL